VSSTAVNRPELLAITEACQGADEQLQEEQKILDAPDDVKTTD
jgi:hypothetical protein